MANPQFADAISGIESGGRYGLLGPVTKSGDRAYGKYQVMGANVPQWTQQFYGQSLTPQQFLDNPQAQDAVFQGQFGQYAQKYGPEGAAKAWFAGEKGMNNPNATDQLGTSVQDYANKFDQGIGQYAQVNSAPLTPGTQAPPLPPPITIGASPQVAQANPFAGLGPTQTASQGASNPFGMLAGLGGGLLQGQQQQMPQVPQPSPNPVQAMAFGMPKPNTQGLQQLLANAPALRGLIV